MVLRSSVWTHWHSSASDRIGQSIASFPSSSNYDRKANCLQYASSFRCPVSGLILPADFTSEWSRSFASITESRSFWRDDRFDSSDCSRNSYGTNFAARLMACECSNSLRVIAEQVKIRFETNHCGSIIEYRHFIPNGIVPKLLSDAIPDNPVNSRPVEVGNQPKHRATVKFAQAVFQFRKPRLVVPERE